MENQEFSKDDIVESDDKGTARIKSVHRNTYVFMMLDERHQDVGVYIIRKTVAHKNFRKRIPTPLERLL